MSITITPLSVTLQGTAHTSCAPCAISTCPHLQDTPCPGQPWQGREKLLSLPGVGWDTAVTPGDSSRAHFSLQTGPRLAECAGKSVDVHRGFFSKSWRPALGSEVYSLKEIANELFFDWRGDLLTVWPSRRFGSCILCSN